MKRILTLLVAVMLTVAGIQSASAQSWPYSPRQSAVATGLIVPVVNASTVRDSTIADGTWLMVDTTTVGIKHIVVKPWIGTAATDHRFCGIAVGRIPGANGTGSMLIQGYHPRAKVITGLTLLDPIGPGFAIYGAGGTAPDSLGFSKSSGVILGYNPSTQASSGVPTARIWLHRIGGFGR